MKNRSVRWFEVCVLVIFVLCLVGCPAPEPEFRGPEPYALPSAAVPIISYSDGMLDMDVTPGIEISSTGEDLVDLWPDGKYPVGGCLCDDVPTGGRRCNVYIEYNTHTLALLWSDIEIGDLRGIVGLVEVSEPGDYGYPTRRLSRDPRYSWDYITDEICDIGGRW